MPRQVSLHDQMTTVMALATDAGCYDAADWLKRNFFAVRRSPRLTLECCARELPEAGTLLVDEVRRCTCGATWAVGDEYGAHIWKLLDAGRLRSTI